MQGVGSFLVVAIALVLLYLLVSGKMDAAVATWKAAATGIASAPTPAAAAPATTAPTGSAAPAAGLGSGLGQAIGGAGGLAALAPLLA